jgi:hypothetical protein
MSLSRYIFTVNACLISLVNIDLLQGIEDNSQAYGIKTSDIIAPE